MTTKKYVVYCHTNKMNGKKYVGITCQKPEKRWSNGKGYERSPHFYSAIQKYGWEEFTHEILFTGLTVDEAKLKEIELIAKWDLTNNENGYNCTEGGDCSSLKGKTRSKESIEKMVATRLKNNTYKNTWGFEVKMFTLSGDFVAKFPSAAQAERDTGICAAHILKCCKNKRKTAGKHIWRFGVKEDCCG